MDSGYLQTGLLSHETELRLLQWIYLRDRYTQNILLMKFKTVDHNNFANDVKFFVKQHDLSWESSCRKSKFKRRKKFERYYWRMSLDKDMPSIFEDSSKIIKFWNLNDNNLCLLCKIQRSLNFFFLKKNEQILTLDYQVMSHCRGGSRTAATSKSYPS